MEEGGGEGGTFFYRRGRQSRKGIAHVDLNTLVRIWLGHGCRRGRSKKKCSHAPAEEE
jgi:hypothetical protein